MYLLKINLTSMLAHNSLTECRRHCQLKKKTNSRWDEVLLPPPQRIQEQCMMDKMAARNDRYQKKNHKTFAECYSLAILAAVNLVFSHVWGLENKSRTETKLNAYMEIAGLEFMLTKTNLFSFLTCKEELASFQMSSTWPCPSFPDLFFSSHTFTIYIQTID